MTRPKLFPVGLLTALCALVIACRSEPASSTAPPDASPIPQPTSTAPASIRVSSRYISQGRDPGEWRVVGMIENQSLIPLGRVRLSVTLLDTAGEIIAQTSEAALMSNLLPGEMSPYSASFDGVAAPAEARIEALRPESTNDSLAGKPPVDHRPELVSALDEFFVNGNGELAIMGFITNPGSKTIALDSFGFLGQASNGEVRSLAAMQFGPNQLAPRETAPFLALAPENPGAVKWILYHDGLVAAPSSSSSLEILEAPMLYLTAQGAPFVVGTLANSGAPASGSVLISLFEGNRLIGLWELETPRALARGEQLPFAAFGFPGVNLRLDSLNVDKVGIEVRVEETAAERSPELIDLPLDVSTFLSVGSAIFLRGTIRNPNDFDVNAATVYGEVRSSTGELITAGWSVANSLLPGDSAEFVLDLPIPVGLDATLTEYDLRAIGLTPQP